MTFLVFVVVPVLGAAAIMILVARWDERRDDKTPRHRHQFPGSRRGARAGDRLREHWRSLPATIRAPFHRELTDEEREWAATLDDITAEQARNRQYPIVTSSPAGTSPDVPAGDAPGPVNNTRRDGPQPAVPAPGPGAPWLPAPIPHNGPWQGHPHPVVHHDEYALPQRWHPEPRPVRDGRAVRPPGALMHPMLPAVIVLRRIILAVEPAATRPWADDTGSFTAIDADIAKADAS